MSPAVLSDVPPSSTSTGPRPTSPPPSPSWALRASRRLDVLAGFLRSAHDHRVPF